MKHGTLTDIEGSLSDTAGLTSSVSASLGYMERATPLDDSRAVVFL